MWSGHCGCRGQLDFHPRVRVCALDDLQADCLLLAVVVRCQIGPGVGEWYPVLVRDIRPIITEEPIDRCLKF